MAQKFIHAEFCGSKGLKSATSYLAALSSSLSILIHGVISSHILPFNLEPFKAVCRDTSPALSLVAHICQSDPWRCVRERLTLSPRARCALAAFFCHNNEKQISRISRLFTFAERTKTALCISRRRDTTHKGIRLLVRGTLLICISMRGAPTLG